MNRKEELFDLFVEFLEERGIDIDSFADGIPISVFCRELGIVETVVRYLKEEKGYSYEKIADMLGRKKDSIGNSYRVGVKKHPDKLDISDSSIKIPYNVLRHENLTMLEAVVKHLKEKCRLNYHNIAILLKRNDRTIWTVYNNSLKKLR